MLRITFLQPVFVKKVKQTLLANICLLWTKYISQSAFRKRCTGIRNNSYFGVATSRLCEGYTMCSLSPYYPIVLNKELNQLLARDGRDFRIHTKQGLMQEGVEHVAE